MSLIKTNKVVVNEIEIVYDEVRFEEFIKIYGPSDELGIPMLIDSPKRQKHYYLSGVKVCTDAMDFLGNNCHNQDLPVLKYTNLNGQDVEVTNLNIWHPDTCKCVIRKWHHVLAPEESHVFDASKCSEHSDCVDHLDVHDVVLSENQSKNKAVSFLCDNYGVEASDVNWRFDGDRKIILSHSSLTEKDKSDVNLSLKDTLSNPMLIE